MQFSLDNRGGPPPIVKTITNLSKIFQRSKVEEKVNAGPRRPKIKRTIVAPVSLVDIPLIIQSRDGFPVSPAPYFTGPPIDFISNLNTYKSRYVNFMFFILANNFVPNMNKMESHMMMGLWIGGITNTLYIVDPNGNDPPKRHIYSGKHFEYPQVGQIQNPLYNTLIALFKPMRMKIRFYTGTPLVCPRGSPANCSYRTIMIMIGLMASPTLDLKNALQIANFLALNNIREVKTLSMKAYENSGNTKQYLFEILNLINENRPNFNTRFISV